MPWDAVTERPINVLNKKPPQNTINSYTRIVTECCNSPEESVTTHNSIHMEPLDCVVEPLDCVYEPPNGFSKSKYKVVIKHK